jgi:hypothetical protein
MSDPTGPHGSLLVAGDRQSVGGSQLATRSPHTIAHLDLDGRVTLGDILRRPSQFMGASYADRVS